MNESELVGELSRRTSLPVGSTAEVLRALRELMLEGVVDAKALLVPVDSIRDPEDPGLVDQLIARAKKHPLGIEFLASGFLASVAIALGAHAFTVEAARRRLAREAEVREKEAEEEVAP